MKSDLAMNKIDNINFNHVDFYMETTLVAIVKVAILNGIWPSLPVFVLAL